MNARFAQALATFALALLLAGCGGGGGTPSPSPNPTPAPPPVVVVEKPTTRSEAARFLTQATFGPTEDDIDRVMSVGYAAWIDEQLALPASSHRNTWEAADIGMHLTESLAMTPAASVSGFYLAHPQAAYFNVGRIGDDQLRDWAARQGQDPAQAARALASLL